jgi:hypothetical protein
MGTLDSFMGQFGAPPAFPAEAGVSSLEELAPLGTGGLDAFIKDFNGMTESFWFYNHTIELRFQTDEHIYYLVGPLGELTAQDGVTNVVHIKDKSNALVPWAAKMVAAKLLRTIPTFEKMVVVPETVPSLKNLPPQATLTVCVPEMTLEAFTKIVLEAKSAPRDVLEEAGDIGHMAHTWLEYFIKALIAGYKLEAESKLLNMPPDERAANCDMAALGWMHKHNVRWIATERKIYSRKYQVAGTMDGLAVVDSCDDPTCCPTPFKDKLSLIDWKSSNYLYIEYLFQTAIYEEALMEEFGGVHGETALDEDGQRIRDAIVKYGPICDRWVNRLGKEDGEFDPWHLTEEDFQEDLEGFLDCLSLTRSSRLVEERMKGQKATIREAKKVAKAAAKEKEKEDKKIAKAADKEAKRVAKETAKMEARKAKAQAKLDEKRAKLADTKVESMVLATEPCPDCGSDHHRSCDMGVDTAKPTPALKVDSEPTIVTADMAAIEQRAVAAFAPRPSIMLNLPVEVVVKPNIQLPEEAKSGN